MKARGHGEPRMVGENPPHERGAENGTPLHHFIRGKLTPCRLAITF
jgi:hypothetical protein